MALAGIALLYRGSDGAVLNTTGVVWVMVSSLSYAMYIVGVNRPQLKGIATLKLTFYALVFGISIFIICTDFCRTLTMPSVWYMWGNVVALALFPTTISFPLHHAGHTVHRFHPDGHTRCAGAHHRRLLRCWSSVRSLRRDWYSVSS